MLRDEGYDVVGQAGDGEEAVRLAEEAASRRRHALDAKMPVLDGISAAGTARRDAHGVQPARARRRARDAGALAYLVKPFTQGDLVPAIVASRHADITTLESEVADLGERLETRNARQSLLRTTYSLSEPRRSGWLARHGPPAVDAARSPTS